MIWAGKIGEATQAAPLRVAGPPEWRVVRETETSGAHCFSVCLYHEPEFARFFPRRNFHQRYLERRDEIAEVFARRNYHLKIFSDQAMLETALGFDFASVYEVTTPPAFPFCQHVWRYWSVLVSNAFVCHHFRGLDNLVVSDTEAWLLEEFLSSGMDLFHCPYQPPRCTYLPVRGSCGVAGQRAIKSLARHLLQVPHLEQREHTAQWHNDEHYLAEWYHEVKHELRLFTVLDREQCPAWHADLDDLVRNGQPMRLVRPVGIPWMRAVSR